MKHLSFHVLAGRDWYHYMNNDPLQIRGLIEQGLSFLYHNDKGSYFTWQIRTEKGNVNSSSDGPLIIKTSHPILHPNLVSFWHSDGNEQIVTGKCNCEITDTTACSCCYDVCMEGKRLFADYKLPGSKLNQKQYTVQGGCTGGGLFGNLIKYNYCSCGSDSCGCSYKNKNDIYVSYISSYNEINCWDQVLPIPYQLLDSLAFYLAALISINSQGFRPGEENTFLSLAQSRRDEVLAYDNKMETEYVTEGFNNYDATSPNSIYIQ